MSENIHANSEQHCGATRHSDFAQLPGELPKFQWSSGPANSPACVKTSSGTAAGQGATAMKPSMSTNSTSGLPKSKLRGSGRKMNHGRLLYLVLTPTKICTSQRSFQTLQCERCVSFVSTNAKSAEQAFPGTDLTMMCLPISGTMCSIWSLPKQSKPNSLTMKTVRKRMRLQMSRSLRYSLFPCCPAMAAFSEAFQAKEA